MAQHSVLIPFTYKGKRLDKDDSVSLTGKAKALYQKLGYVKETAPAKEAAPAKKETNTKAPENKEPGK